MYNLTVPLRPSQFLPKMCTLKTENGKIGNLKGMKAVLRMSKQKREKVESRIEMGAVALYIFLMALKKHPTITIYKNSI